MYLIEQCVYIYIYIYIYENERQNIHFLNSRGGPFQKLLSTEGKVLCWHLRIEYFQCERCPRGFQTVFAACLTLFSQILGSWMRIIGNGSSFPWRDNGMPCQTKLFQGLKQYLFSPVGKNHAEPGSWLAINGVPFLCPLRNIALGRLQSCSSWWQRSLSELWIWSWQWSLGAVKIKLTWGKSHHVPSCPIIPLDV